MDLLKDFVNTIVIILILIAAVGMAFIPWLLDTSESVANETGGQAGDMTLMIPVFVMIGVALMAYYVYIQRGE